MKFTALIFFAVILVLPACNGNGENGESNTGQTFGIEANSNKLQAGFLTVGSVSDWGYNYQHNQGRLFLEASLGDRVHTFIAENVPETVDVERMMQRMVRAGADIIFATSYGYADMVARVSEKNPETVFMQAWGTNQNSNMGTYSLAAWQPAYVCGVVTATMLEGENQFGFIAAQPVPPILWTVNAFALGLQSVNPEAKVNVVYTNKWVDPAAERDAVNSLAAQGAKAIYVFVDSPIAAVRAAEEAEVYALSNFADMARFAPKYWLTGSVWNWGLLYERVVQDILNESWQSKHYTGDFTNGYVGIASYGPSVSELARSAGKNITAELEAGTLKVFTGPIYDSDGQLRVEEGDVLKTEDIVSFNWVVKGVNNPLN